MVFWKYCRGQIYSQYCKRKFEVATSYLRYIGLSENRYPIELKLLVIYIYIHMFTMLFGYAILRQTFTQTEITFTKWKSCLSLLHRGMGRFLKLCARGGLGGPRELERIREMRVLSIGSCGTLINITKTFCEHLVVVCQIIPSNYP